MDTPSLAPPPLSRSQSSTKSALSMLRIRVRSSLSLIATGSHTLPVTPPPRSSSLPRPTTAVFVDNDTKEWDGDTAVTTDACPSPKRVDPEVDRGSEVAATATVETALRVARPVLWIDTSDGRLGRARNAGVKPLPPTPHPVICLDAYVDFDVKETTTGDLADDDGMRKLVPVRMRSGSRRKTVLAQERESERDAGHAHRWGLGKLWPVTTLRRGRSKRGNAEGRR